MDDAAKLVEIKKLADQAWDALSDERQDRQTLLENLIADIRRVLGTDLHKAKVILFKPSGKYYTEEEWRVPEGAIGPWVMMASPDSRRISGGPVLVVGEDMNWAPHLFPGE